MKKILLGAMAVLISAASFGQAVSDRAVIPVAVNLNQVLRIQILNGGNIEFVFNSIDDYTQGLSGDGATSGANPAGSSPMYVTDLTISSSVRWELTYGSEEATFIGVTDMTNTLALDNVGFDLVANGIHAFGTEVTSAPTTDGTVIADLDVFPVVLITDNSNVLANAGDNTDNDFQMVWRCGTVEGDMNGTNILNQAASPVADRYVTNVLFELAAL